jgi:hypothetical protein
MDDYLEEIRSLRIRGIPARDWLAFFQRFKEGGK